MELARALQQICTDPSLRERLGQAAARTALAHTWDRNAAATWEFLQAAMQKKN
jgi:glycosyltransferase involved in cell wall biosynthesis